MDSSRVESGSPVRGATLGRRWLRQRRSSRLTQGTSMPSMSTWLTLRFGACPILRIFCAIQQFGSQMSAASCTLPDLVAILPDDDGFDERTASSERKQDQP